MGMQTDKVRFNVGGKIFETTATTLANAGRNSLFGAMFDEQWNLRPREANDEYFIDRDPKCFSVLLNLLRTGELHVPSNIPEKLLYKEALFYGLLENLRTAKWARFDGNRLGLTRSVRGPRGLQDCTAIRASPDGGCAVAHGSIVHVYNWMLEERTPLNFEYRQVNDIGWIDSENIVISASQKLGNGYGGIGLFSSSTGDLRHIYQVNSPIAGALCFNRDSKIFASCGRAITTDGIGVWDKVTGKQIDYFSAPSDWRLGYADKIQWLSGSNCLLVSALFYHSRICVLDFRDRRMVWSWSEQSQVKERAVYDAIAMEESNSICVASDGEDLGFIDLRSTVGGGIRWNPRNRGNGQYVSPCHPRLALHGGQVFYSWNDSISVFSDPEYSIATSSLGRSCAGSIRDFSVGGDRLFALHKEENVFDVWETPSPPVI